MKHPEPLRHLEPEGRGFAAGMRPCRKGRRGGVGAQRELPGGQPVGGPSGGTALLSEVLPPIRTS